MFAHPETTTDALRAREGPIADALIVVSCAYTSLTTSHRFGLLDRERAFYARLWPNFSTIVFVSYGGPDDHAVVSSLVPTMLGRVHCVCNDRALEPATFLSGVPDSVRRTIAGARSALILTEQHWGGEVAVTIARSLRHAGIRTGLAARCGYHWSWTMMREHGPASRQFAESRFLEGELCRAADIVIATTPRILDDLAFQHALPRENLRLVPNYVLTTEPPAPISSRSRNLILTAGRLSREKRVSLLIESIAALPAPMRAGARLLVVGDGPETDSLKSLAARLDIPTEFRARIPHTELLALMRSCRVYSQCSEYEGHPKTVLEAMAAGAPVLVTDSPGLADRLRHNTTGLIARPDPQSLAASLSKLLTDDALADSLSRSAAREIRDSLGLDAVFPFYRQACADAMTTAGAHSDMPAAIVRWDQPLLNLSPDAAAAAWHSSIHAYSKRLTPSHAAIFEEQLRARMEPVAPSLAKDRS